MPIELIQMRYNLQCDCFAGTKHLNMNVSYPKQQRVKTNFFLKISFLNRFFFFKCNGVVHQAFQIKSFS